MRLPALPVLFVTIFFDMLGVGILIPVIPAIFADPASSHFILDPGVSPERAYLYLGGLVALFSIGQFVAAPIIGQFSDIFGRKRVLATAIFGLGIFGHGLFALGIALRSLPILFLSRILSGLSAGNIVVAQAAIADLSKPEDRAKNFGLIGAAFGLGFILGPWIGGMLADPNVFPWSTPATPFIFAMALSVLNAVLVLLFFRETHPHRPGGGGVAWGRAIHNVRHAFALPHLRAIFTTNFLMSLGFAFYFSFASVFLFWRFSMSEATIGNYFAYIGLWIVFTQAIVTRIAAKHFSEERILAYALPGMGLAILLVALAPVEWMLYVIVPFFAMTTGLSQANLTALLSRQAGPEEQGEILGVNGSVMALATALPPLSAGFLAAMYHPDTPLLLAGIIVLLSGWYFSARAFSARK